MDKDKKIRILLVVMWILSIIPFIVPLIYTVINNEDTNTNIYLIISLTIATLTVAASIVLLISIVIIGNSKEDKKKKRGKNQINRKRDKKMNLEEMINLLELKLSNTFLSEYYQDEILKKDIVNKQIYIFNKNEILLISKPLYVYDPFTNLNEWIPSDDSSRNYKYNSEFKYEFKTLKLKPINSIKIKVLILNIYLFTE